MTVMHKGKANGIGYRLQMARVFGRCVHKKSHFGRHVHGYPDADHPGACKLWHVKSKVDVQMHQIVSR